MYKNNFVPYTLFSFTVCVLIAIHMLYSFHVNPVIYFLQGALFLVWLSMGFLGVLMIVCAMSTFYKGGK
jgi:hypothetical protein